MEKRCFRIVAVLLVLLSGCRPSAPNGPAPDQAGTNRAAGGAGGSKHTQASGFDFYLLNLSWSPEFCYSHPAAAECAEHASFVLHGLWPQNSDGTYPENCSNAPGPADLSQYRDIYPDPGLLNHEWTEHGTCSGLNADSYFATARRAFHSVAIPPKLSGLHAQTSMSPEEILDLFAASNPEIPRTGLALSCGHNYLTAVEICLNKDLHPIACPAVRSCKASVVRIPPP